MSKIETVRQIAQRVVLEVNRKLISAKEGGLTTAEAGEILAVAMSEAVVEAMESENRACAAIARECVDEKDIEPTIVARWRR